MSYNTVSLSSGFVQIPFTKAGVFHFKIDGQLNDREISVMVNVGASSSVIDLSVAQSLGLPMVDLALMPGATTGRGEIYQVQSGRLYLGGVNVKLPVLLAMDMTMLMHSLALVNTPKVDVIIGIDMLESYSAVVDYGNKLLCLKM